MIRNVAASVRARLYNKSKDSGVEFQLLLARYAGERFLYRLGVSSCRDRCILKGATLLVVWMEEPYRSTRDIDLLALGYNDEASVQEIVKTVCAVACPEDGLTFDLDSVRISPIRAQQQFQGQRVGIICRLGQARIPIQIDFGFGDAVTPAPHEMSMSTLIKGIPAPVVLVYPMVTSLAEKFDAMVSLGKRNSRMKDFYDVWALSEAFTFEGKALREAVHSCFERRRTPVSGEIPAALTSVFYSDAELNILWRDYRSEGTLLSPPPEAFEVVGERVRSFFAQVHASIVADIPFDLHWPVGGPWQRWKSYPVYKDSGVEWLGKIPAHWEISRLSEQAMLINGYPFDSQYFVKEEGIPLIRIRDLNALETAVNYSGEIVESALIESGDIIVGMDGDFNVSRWRGKRALLNQRMCCLRAKRDTDTGFVAYFLPFPLKVIEDLTHSTTVKHLSSGDVRKIRLGVAPSGEQRAIAAFLDRETEKIDALVDKKKRLIELLQEKRTALIIQAVTKGLDPDIPMKDSGIEWLGEVPEHWDIKRIKHLLVSRKGAIKTGPFGSQLHSSEMMGSEIKVFNQRTVINRDIHGGLNYISMAKFNELKAFEAFPGDLLVTTRGTIGRCMIIPSGAPRGILHPCLLRIQIDARLAYDHYIEFLIEESGLTLAQLLFMSNSTTIEVIYSDSLKEILLPIPPLSEQHAIAAFLDRETAKIDALIAKIQEAIGLLKEQRTALISAAVTGKIDVREAMA